MTIAINNKKVCEKVYGFQKLLKAKTGKQPTLTKTIDIMFSDDNIISKFSQSNVTKKKRRKDEYVFKI